MFEKFAQANNGDGQHKSGTGLGLSIVRQIVLHMGGEVGFDDAPGGGTVFYVDLPCAGRLADRAKPWRRAFGATPFRSEPARSRSKQGGGPRR